MAKNSETPVFKANDRVRRISKIGCSGTVKELRVETTVSQVDTSTDAERAKAVMVNVCWDNGTISYLAPEALELSDAAK
jgi:hypothetical protein